MGTLGGNIAVRDFPRRFRQTLGQSSSGPDVGGHGGKVKGPGGLPDRRAPASERRRIGHCHSLQAFDEICGVNGGQGLARKAGMAAHWWPHHIAHGPAHSQPSFQIRRLCRYVPPPCDCLCGGRTSFPCSISIANSNLCSVLLHAQVLPCCLE